MADTDTEKYYVRIISAMNSDKRYNLLKKHKFTAEPRCLTLCWHTLCTFGTQRKSRALQNEKPPCLPKSKNWDPPGLLQRAPGPFGPGTPKESEKSPKGCPPRRASESPKSAPRSPKRVQKRSFGLFLDSFRTPGRILTLFGLFWASGSKGSGSPL